MMKLLCSNTQVGIGEGGERKFIPFFITKNQIYPHPDSEYCLALRYYIIGAKDYLPEDLISQENTTQK